MAANEHLEDIEVTSSSDSFWPQAVIRLATASEFLRIGTVFIHCGIRRVIKPAPFTLIANHVPFF